MKSKNIYFGGSRTFNPTEKTVAIMRAVMQSEKSVHVGCQYGADQAVISYFSFFTPSSLSVYVVAPSAKTAPRHIQQLPASVKVTFSAGGQGPSIPARYLLRSIAAFKGCEQAVFFNPGIGSLAVARECVRSGLQVFAFQQEPPAPIASCQGQWLMSFFQGFQCWAWGTLSKQISLF